MWTQKEENEQKAILTTAHTDFQKGMNSHAFFKVSNHATGEDMVQDTFTRTWSYLVKGGKIDVMKAFLYHILNNLIVDEYRKRKTVSLDVMIEKGLEPASGDSSKLLNLLDGKAALVLIQRLPEKYQKVMRMRYIQDLSLHEMSLITGETKNAMAVKAHRGLEKLKLLHSPKPEKVEIIRHA